MESREIDLRAWDPRAPAEEVGLGAAWGAWALQKGPPGSAAPPSRPRGSCDTRRTRWTREGPSGSTIQRSLTDMPNKLLIANRGEIAVRIARAAAELGLPSRGDLRRRRRRVASHAPGRRGPRAQGRRRGGVPRHRPGGGCGAAQRLRPGPSGLRISQRERRIRGALRGRGAALRRPDPRDPGAPRRQDPRASACRGAGRSRSSGDGRRHVPRRRPRVHGFARTRGERNGEGPRRGRRARHARGLPSR